MNIETFLNYKPMFSEKEIDNYFEDVIKREVISYLGEEAGVQIQKAYDFAKKSHGDEKRLSGEPYIVHPVYVTKYLLMIEPDIYALQAALLHDVIEDTDVTSDEILEEFGPKVAFLCLGLEKVSRVRYYGEDRQIETLKKTFLAMGHDIRVIFVKLADRMHNIQTLKYHPKREKQLRIANETLKIYAPIAKRLGIEIFQLYLENGAFAILEPEEFNRITKYLNKHYSKLNIEKILLKLKKDLKVNNIDYITLKGRLKSPYRIYKKFEKYNTRNISEIKDILAFRIIVKDIPTCYTTLGVIHSQYTPIIKRIKDYISIPKPNGYQSLHTTILGLYKEPVEIQIRTQQMDELAEYGVAAHFLYKERGKSDNADKNQIEWINKLKNIVQEYKENTDNSDFLNVLDVEFLRKSVFAYTPSGKVIELPRGATVLDFAFRIHTDVGLKFKSANVNGKIVPIDYKLRNGDIVEIKTFRNKYSVKQKWLSYVISHTSKAKIRQYLNMLEKENNIVLGKYILNEELKKLNLPELGTKGDIIAEKITSEELERNLVQINNKNLSVTKFIKQFYPHVYSKIECEKSKIKNSVQKLEKEVKDNVIIDNSRLFKYDFCPDCKPRKGDKIIGKVSNDGIKIHKLTCRALKNVNFQKLVEAHWQNQDNNYYHTLVIFDITKKGKNFIKLLNKLEDMNVEIVCVNKGENKGKQILRVEIVLPNPTRLYFIKQKFKKECNHLFNTMKVQFLDK